MTKNGKMLSMLSRSGYYGCMDLHLYQYDPFESAVILVNGCIVWDKSNGIGTLH